MFRADTKPTHPRKLHVVASGAELEGNRKGEMKMKAYKFAAYPSNSSVASGVTMLVSVWFLVAAGAILTDPSSPYTQRSQVQAAPSVQYAEEADTRAASTPIAPDAHFTIVVEARRAVDRPSSAHL